MAKLRKQFAKTRTAEIRQFCCCAALILAAVALIVSHAPAGEDDAIDLPEVKEFAPNAVDPNEIVLPKIDSSLTAHGVSRMRLVRSEGGSVESERAVENALEWIARNQLPDGGWDFRENKGVKGGSCDGTMDARNAATAMALLPFLGAGYTHQEGKYKTQVHAGLNYLIKQIKLNAASGGGSLISSGRNYDHGLALIALAEAYAMTEDANLRMPVTAAAKFSIYAQDPKTGGWMYGPRQGGDTSVSGWHLMGLKSAAMAKLPVPKDTFALTRKYLNSVAAEKGKYYGYRIPQVGRQAMTAAGHLCMIYLGQDKKDAGLQSGAEVISKWGPNLENLYYSYYATQVMFQMGGDQWKKWNEQMRDPLIAKQSKEGITKGSWKLAGPDHGYRGGGRLYTTSLATLMLEVYYRHARMYEE